jgi:ABC-2 type transport system ATP-binding protein
MSKNNNIPPAIEARDLVKRFGEEVLAVDGVNLAIPANTIYALLGPNGAGKTTTINMLTTLLEPTDGSAKVAGFDVLSQANEVRKHIGVTFQEMVLDDELTGRQVLDYHGRLYGQSRSERQEQIEELLTLVELNDAADRIVRTYSGGMKRRLELARSLMTTPQVLFLDEPTLGLDPQTRGRVWDYIRDLKEKRGMTLLLTTHYMDEAEQLADIVGIMDHGKIVEEGSPQKLIDQLGSDVIRIIGQGDKEKFIAAVDALSFVQMVTSGDEGIQVAVGSGNRRLVAIVSLARENDFDIEDVSVSKPSLGEAFFKFTGRQLRDE